MRHVRLVRDDLLRTQRDACRLLGRQGHRLVHRVGMQALRAAKDTSERLDGCAHDVDLGLLRSERDAGSLRVKAQLHASFELSAVATLHPSRPDTASCAVLRNLLEEVDVRVEEERQARCEQIDRQARSERKLDIRKPVGQGECQFFGSGGSSLTNVITADADAVPPGHFCRCEGDGVANKSHALTWREDEFLLRLILLEDVVLQRAAEASTGRACLLRLSDEHGEDGGGRRVDGHAGGGRTEVDVGVQILHVGERVDRDPAAPDFTQRHWMVGIEPKQRWHIEGRG